MKTRYRGTAVFGWLLIISGYHGGMVAVPQPSHERCIQQAEWINKTKGGSDRTVMLDAFCVEGVTNHDS